jgi:Cd2+/Zn2+-exporting ATPase
MKQNVSVSLITKAIFVVLAPLGFVSLITAIAVDMGVSLLVTLNGLRLLRRPATHSLRETPGDPDPVAGATGAEGDACEEDCCSPAVSDGKAVELPIFNGNRGT